MARRKKRGYHTFFKEHNYVVILLILVVFLFAFAFLSPVGFGGDITGFQSLDIAQSNPQVAALSFFMLVFGVLFLIVFTFNLMSRVL
jgi:hypothetical protein|tara:strand:+ start:25476 stop:25736 length:261 start_codon:yes stop_codon:yes gene_type:complete